MAFVAKSGEIESFHSLIGSIAAFGTNAIVTFHSDRMVIGVVDANVCKVELNVSSPSSGSSLFKSWENTFESVITIGIDLSDVLDTFNFHSSIEGVEFTLQYDDGSNQLILTFNDDLIIETCTLQTYVVESSGQGGDDEGFQLDSFGVISEIVIKSSILFDILKDMKGLHTEKFIIYCLKRVEGYSEKNQLIFISQSKLNSIGLSKLIVPQTRSNIQQFDIFKLNNGQRETCFNTSLSCNYLYIHFSKLLKALKYSRSVKIRRDLNGLTSVVLLLGEPSDHQRKLYQGCSLDFTTLESTGMEIMGVPVNNDGVGYADNQIDQLIKDDEDISTIRIGTDGQLTLDDYFQTRAVDRIDDYETGVPRGSIITSKSQDEIQITPELAQTLLGGGAYGNGVSVQSTPIGTVLGPSNEKSGKIPNVPTPQIRSKKPRNRTKRSKRSNDGVETVGGAVEIPLFI